MIEKASSFSFYTKDSRIRALIHNLKYKGIKEIGPELGRIYGNQLKASDFFRGMDFIVPVPLHPSRIRQRGYNQSTLIAEGITSVSGLPLRTDILLRNTVTKTQTKKSRYDRWINVHDIFIVKDQEEIRGKHILIVDDVITTGSTVEACANALLGPGNTKVSVVSLGFSVI